MSSQNQLLLKGVRDALIAAGVVRLPSTGGSTPPLWLDPRNGVPAPGQAEGLAPAEVGDHAVLAAFLTTPVSMPRYEQNILAKPTVEIWVCVDSAPLAYELGESIASQFRDKRDYNLPNGLWISESLEYRGLQRLDSGPSGFTYNTQYIFEIWAP